MTYNADIPLLFSEIDPAQNNAVDRCCSHRRIQRDQGLVGTAGWLRQSRFGDLQHLLSAGRELFAAVLPINGVAFDRTHPDASKFVATAGDRASGISRNRPGPPGECRTADARSIHCGIANGAACRRRIRIDRGRRQSTSRHNPRAERSVHGSGQDLRRDDQCACCGQHRPCPFSIASGSLSGNASRTRRRNAGLHRHQWRCCPNAPSSARHCQSRYLPICFDGQTLTVSDPTKGVIANDSTFTALRLPRRPAHGALTLKPDGTFTYTAEHGCLQHVQLYFTYCANGSTTACATVTLGAAPIETATGISCKRSQLHFEPWPRP